MCEFAHELFGDGPRRDAVTFTLRYDGELPACSQRDTRTKEKHEIRRELSFQLAQLWAQEPALSSRLKRIDKFDSAVMEKGRIAISGVRGRRLPAEPHHSVYKFQLDGFTFIPLVTSINNLWCELDVQLQRDGDPGHVLKSSGDLDNRIKTLFDALRMPHSSDELSGAKPESADPFFCLLEDDSLITKLSVATQRRLRKRGEPSTFVEMQINVRVIARKVTDYNRDYLTG